MKDSHLLELRIGKFIVEEKTKKNRAKRKRKKHAK